MPAQRSRRRIRFLAATYELPWREVITDARVAAAWPLPLDELVVWFSEHHRWGAELSVLYLTALRRLGNQGTT